MLFLIPLNFRCEKCETYNSLKMNSCFISSEILQAYNTHFKNLQLDQEFMDRVTQSSKIDNEHKARAR